MLKRYVGNAAFYKKFLVVVLPIIIQNAITNFVSMLDNIMVGQMGEVQMSGVAIVNQILFVFNLCVFGAVSGAGIFTAQFHGSNDTKSVKYSFRFKIIISAAITSIGIGVLALFGEDLVKLFLQGDGNVSDIEGSLQWGMKYLSIMLVGLIPYAASNVYSSTLRETGYTFVPMIAGVVAVGVNLVLNFVLIFGVESLSIPSYGAVGAAIATVISRFVELSIVALATHISPQKHPYIKGVYRGLYIPASLFGKIFVKSLPLMLNETLWAAGQSFMNQCYSIRGFDVVSAMSISSTIYNLMGVIYMATGVAVGIVMGQMLGAGKSKDEIRDTNRKLITFAVVSCVIFGGLLAAVSGVFPRLYKTTDSIKELATLLICVSAAAMPFAGYVNAAYFTLRSGGQTLVTFVFDSCFVWIVSVPVAFVLSRFTDISVVWLYAICCSTDVLKCIIGAFMLKNGSWMKNLTNK